MKNRVTGNVAKKFKVKFNRDEDTYLVLYKNKDAARESIDNLQGGDLRDLANMFCALFLEGTSKDRLLGHLVITGCVSHLTKQREESQYNYETQKYRDAHNGGITGKDNNLPPDKEK
jgi:hypothetical protein